MKDVLAALLALIESKSIPAAFKFLLGSAALAVLLRLAGFPVVNYVETGIREAFTKAPSIAGLATGLLIGSLIGYPLKGIVSALVKLSVTAFDFTNQERKFVGRVLSVVGFSILVGLITVAVCLVARSLGDL